MSADTLSRLRELARTDATAAPLARLQLLVQQAATDRGWDDALPAPTGGRLEASIPLLHDVEIVLPLDRFTGLLDRLTSEAEARGAPELRDLRRRLASARIDAAAIAVAAIAQDHAQLHAIAGAGGLDAALLGTLANLAVTPLLLAYAHRAAPLLERLEWDASYCPVCAAWPALAELRGLERRRWPRCGRCGAGWQRLGQACLYCDNTDFNTLGYLAPESDRESRRAATCDRCLSYLKTLTTLAPLSPLEVTVSDLTTIELDVAALERGYARPETSGFPLAVSIVPARRAGLLGRRR